MVNLLIFMKGYTDSIRGLIKLGLLNPKPEPVLHENGRKSEKGDSQFLE